MAFIKVKLNGKDLAIGGNKDIELISLSIVGHRSTEKPWLRLGGHKRPDSEIVENFDWISQSVNDQDFLTVELLENEVSDEAISQNTAKSLSPKEILSLLKERSHENHGEVDSKNEIGDSYLAFDILLSSDERIIATLGDEETLQLVINWHKKRGSGILEVDSLSVDNEGYTSGKRWLEKELHYKDLLSIRILTSPYQLQ